MMKTVNVSNCGSRRWNRFALCCLAMLALPLNAQTFERDIDYAQANGLTGVEAIADVLIGHEAYVYLSSLCWQDGALQVNLSDPAKEAIASDHINILVLRESETEFVGELYFPERLRRFEVQNFVADLYTIGSCQASAAWADDEGKLVPVRTLHGKTRVSDLVKALLDEASEF